MRYSLQNDPDYKILNKYNQGLNIIMENISKGISGPDMDILMEHGEDLNDSLIERAKYVAQDLLNNEEFITFSKKNNPEMLETVKKLSKQLNEGK